MCSTGFQIFFPLEVSWGVFGGKKLASKYLFICCCLSLSLSVQNSIWHSSSDILQDGEFYKRTISSVTRCWSKKQPIFLQKLPKKYPHKFNIKMQFFTIALNVAKYLGYFVPKNFFPKNFQKSLNLVTLTYLSGGGTVHAQKGPQYAHAQRMLKYKLITLSDVMNKI